MTHQTYIHYKLRPTGGGSDITLKKEVEQLHGALDSVLALRPVTWRWKTKKDTTQYGFIAQEVEHILPQFVNNDTWEDGSTRKFLNMDGMVPYLVGAVQEQQKQIETLQSRLASLNQ